MGQLGSGASNDSDFQPTQKEAPVVTLDLSSEIELDLKATNTYEFVFRHKQQYLVDEKYPTVANPFGTLNNFTIVYANKIRSDTPRKSESSPSPIVPSEREKLRPPKDIKGNVFSWRKV